MPMLKVVILVFVSVVWLATIIVNLYLPHRIAMTKEPASRKDDRCTKCKWILLAVRVALFIGLLIYGENINSQTDGSLFALIASGISLLSVVINLSQRRIFQKKYGFRIDSKGTKSVILGMAIINLLFFLVFPAILLE